MTDRSLSHRGIAIGTKAEGTAIFGIAEKDVKNEPTELGWSCPTTSLQVTCQALSWSHKVPRREQPLPSQVKQTVSWWPFFALVSNPACLVGGK